MNRLGRLAVCGLLASFALPAAAQRRPILERAIRNGKLQRNGGLPIVRRALAAWLRLRFSGRRTVTLLREGQLDRHEEIVMRDGERSRIEFPSGSAYDGQVIVEDATERRHYLPDQNTIRVLPARRDEGLTRLRALLRDGAVTTQPGDRVAGFATVDVTGKDAAGNVVQRFAIEPTSGMVLRYQLYDATGTELGGYAYSKVDLTPGPFAPTLFQLERRGVKLVTPYDQLKILAKRVGYPPMNLPSSTGFRLDSVRIVKFDEGRVLAQNYVGPGGRVSLYELQAAVSPARLRRQGGRVLNTLSWSANGTSFVLVGPQDDATLARLKAALGP